MPRFGGIEAECVGRYEQRNFFEFGRAGCLQRQQAGMLQVGETEAVVVLNHLDAVKDAAAHITRTFPRIHAVARDDDGRLAGFQLALQIGVALLAQQAFAD